MSGLNQTVSLIHRHDRSGLAQEIGTMNLAAAKGSAIQDAIKQLADIGYEVVLSGGGYQPEPERGGIEVTDKGMRVWAGGKPEPQPAPLPPVVTSEMVQAAVHVHREFPARASMETRMNACLHAALAVVEPWPLKQMISLEDHKKAIATAEKAFADAVKAERDRCAVLAGRYWSGNARTSVTPLVEAIYNGDAP